MSVEGEILANAGQTESAQGDGSGEEDVNEAVERALENDPQRKLSRQVAEDLAAAGVDDPDTQSAEVKPSPEQDAEFKAEKQRIQQALAKRNDTFKQREAAS